MSIPATGRKAAIFGLALASLGLGTPALADHHEEAGEMVHATLIGADGASHGMVMVQDTPSGVLITTELEGLPAGTHAFHFHEKGMCEPAEGFKTAGGHFAPMASKHGLMVEGGPHGGDMPNQTVGADGKLETQILNTGVTLAAGPKSLFDADGSALVIHAGADDYKSQPSGDACGRIACAVIAATK